MNRYLLVAAMFLVSVVARADGPPAPRPIDMTVFIVDENGKALKDPMDVDVADPNCLKCRNLTLGHAIARALFATLPGDEKTDPLQKWARSELAKRIMDSKEAVLTSNEITAIKRQIGSVYGGLVLGQIYPVIDPNVKVPDVQ